MRQSFRASIFAALIVTGFMQMGATAGPQSGDTPPPTPEQIRAAMAPLLMEQSGNTVHTTIGLTALKNLAAISRPADGKPTGSEKKLKSQ